MKKFHQVWEALKPVFETTLINIEHITITEDPVDMGPNHFLQDIYIKLTIGYDGRNNEQ